MRAIVYVLVATAACDKGPPRPSAIPGYTCKEPPSPAELPQSMKLTGSTLVWDPTACEPSAKIDMGSWYARVLGRDGDLCAFEWRYVEEGGYSIYRCTVPAVGTHVAVPVPGSGTIENCTVTGSGDVWHDHDNAVYWFQTVVPGTHYVVHRLMNPSAAAKAPSTPPGTPRVARGSRLHVAYQLFDDTAFERKTQGAGATGELTFHWGAGEAGAALDSALELNMPQGAAPLVQFRAEIAQVLRDKLPPHGEDANICIELRLDGIEPPAPSTHDCPLDQVWACQLGPTSVDNRGDAKYCGCRYEHCPNHGFLWTVATDDKWPDGAHKASYECIDDHERIQRVKALAAKGS